MYFFFYTQNILGHFEVKKNNNSFKLPNLKYILLICYKEGTLKSKSPFSVLNTYFIRFTYPLKISFET